MIGSEHASRLRHDWPEPKEDGQPASEQRQARRPAPPPKKTHTDTQAAAAAAALVTMTDEEKLCTALSLLLYGDALRLEASSEEEKGSLTVDEPIYGTSDHGDHDNMNVPSGEESEERNQQLQQWLIDDGVLNQGIFLRSDDEADLIDIGQGGEGPGKGEEETEVQTLFLAPLPPTAPPPPRTVGGGRRGEGKERPDSPLPSAIFLRSYDGPNDDWVIA